MPNRIVTDLAADQSLVLNGPGAIKINAVKTVTLSKSKIAGTKAAASASHIKAAGVAQHVTSMATSLSPVLGSVTLSLGPLAIVSMWAKR